MQTIKAIYKGRKTIQLLEELDLARGTRLELTMDIPKDSQESELGQSIVRGLHDAVSGRIRVVENAENIESWAEKFSDKI
ncbi:MAG: hypothetical protein ACE5HO_08090 [bacterium]